MRSAQSGKVGAARLETAMAAGCAVRRVCLRLLCMAQVSSYGDKQMGPTNDKPPAILNGVGIAQHLNEQLPLNLTFTDDAGKQVQLGSYFGKTAGDSGAGVLPVPDALLGGAERADERVADGETSFPARTST